MNHEVVLTTCPELVGRYQPEQWQNKTMFAPRINLHDFDELPGGGWQVIRSFSERARSKPECQPEDSFEPFIFAWIALNSWASRVTGSDTDRPYLNPMMLDHIAMLIRRIGRRPEGKFGRLLIHSSYKDSSIASARRFWSARRDSRYRFGYSPYLVYFEQLARISDSCAHAQVLFVACCLRRITECLAVSPFGQIAWRYGVGRPSAVMNERSGNTIEPDEIMTRAGKSVRFHEEVPNS